MSATEQPTTHRSFCRICESLCGLEVDVREDRIVSIRPDPSHVATGGFGCVKGLKQHRIYDSPDRLMRPLEREGREVREVSWDRALGRIGERVRRIVEEHGPDAVAMYVGTAAGFSVLHPIFAQGFMDGIGSKSMYASATQDCSNKFAVAHAMYGFCFTQPFPDVDHTECLIIVGANPVVSKWSFLQVPNPTQRIKEIQARGGKVIVVDPRRTETAKIASEYVSIRAGSDPFFYLAFVRELLSRGGHDRAALEEVARGLEQVEAAVAPWTPERAAEVTGIPAETLVGLVDAYLEADGASLYSSTGVNMGGQGALCFWLQEVANLVSGNLDRRGGLLVGQGVIDFPKFATKRGLLTRRDRSRVGDFGSVNDAFPGGLLADEILTPGEGKVRALFVTGGNPLITMPNSNRLREAFGELDLLVTLDIFRNETGTLAHYVLPCTAPFERPDLPFVFPLMLGLQSRPYLQATRAVVPPRGEQRDEATIYTQLARACGRPLFGSAAAQRALELFMKRRGPSGQPGLPQEGLLSLLLRITGQGSFKRLLGAPNGRAQPEHAPGSFLGQRVYTEDGRVDLAPTALVERAETMERLFEEERARADELRLITKRAVTTHNSWTHNLEDFVPADGRDTNHLYVHPDDARDLGLEEGALADVRTAVAAVRLPVRFCDDLRPRTVALPHGWGHQHAEGLSVASRTRGVNVNVLAGDGPEALDRLSGMARLTGIPVEVSPAAGPLDPSSWTGLPEDRYPGPPA